MQYTKKLYNILAYILRKIKNITDERNFEHLRTVKPEYEIEITERLKRRFPDMFNKYTRNVAEISEWRLANSALLYDLGKYLESSEDIEELIFLVKIWICIWKTAFMNVFQLIKRHIHLYV